MTGPVFAPISSRPPPTVCLIPESPCYGSHSMRRYWNALVTASREGDPFALHSIVGTRMTERKKGMVGRFERFFSRSLAYPSLIRRNFTGRIAHVLDHSWADMLQHVPVAAVKVVTVHDLIPLRFPGELKPGQLARYRKWVDHMHRADVILSVSEYTKNETVALLGIPPEKIKVVPSGVDAPAPGGPGGSVVQDRLAALSPGAHPPLRLGSIGSTLMRKNLDIFPAALAAFQARSSRKIQLVRVGSMLPAALAESIRQVVGPDGLIEFGLLPDEDLDGFYKSIDVMVIPSLYEGFGLPVLEAMAHGVPVISSRSSSLPEVGADAALYFDPASPEDLAKQLQLLESTDCANSLADRGLKRAADFTWRRCLEGIFEVYHEEMTRKSP